MSKNTLNITWLYPDLLNLHGDRGNIMAFEKVGEEMGIDVRVKRVDTFSEDIDFENSDIIFLNVGEIKTIKPIAENIKKFGNAVYDFVNSGKTLIAIGTSGAILANSLKRCDGEVYEGLGILDMDCVEREFIYGDDLHFKTNDEEIVAVQIHLVDFFLKNEKPLGKIIYGKGNNDTDCTEGARKQNVIFTNALGPVFVKNPWFTQQVILDSVKSKGIICSLCDEKFFEIERNSAEAVKRFINKKTEK